MDIESLIDKVLRNKASKEEIAIVEKWKAETEANLNAMREMQEMLSESRALKSYKDFNKKEAWANIEESIVFDEVKSKPKLFSMKKFKWVGVAASFLLLISFALFFQQNNQGSSSWSADSEIITFDLEDGSNIWLNKGSELSQVSDFTQNRELKLNGEAFFNVVRNENLPFVVYTGDKKIEVLGTQFNVKYGSSFLQVFVSEGKVRVDGFDDPVFLEKGQMLSYNKGRYEVHNSENEVVDDWKEGKLVFRSFPLTQALMEIENRYNVSFQYDKENMLSCNLSSTFHRETIEEVLEELKLVFNLDYKIIGRNVDILNVNCD